MKYREKIVQMEFLNDEERVIRRLQAVYNQSLKDITRKSNTLQKEIYKIQDKYNSIENEHEREILKSMERSKVYQKQYQDSLKKQVNGILDKMHQKEFKTVNEYLNECYDKSFTGNMYVLHGEGIPLIVPIDQEKVVRAVQINSKINKGLYSRLGEDVDLLKRKITAQISRGVATGMSYSQMAQQLAGYTKIGYNNAVRITRTEGHRIQQESTMDACYAARERGADVVKQWDATMDANTRESHQKVDGEIRELDERFSNGLRYPGDPSGSAVEVVNCRCVLLQRAKWALDEKELERLKDRASFYGLDKEKEFNKFAEKYLKTVENPAVQLEDYENEFKKLTEGYYTYDDFMKDYASIEDGFEGADADEIKRAKDIAEKIKSLRNKLKNVKNTENTVYTKAESIRRLKERGIDLKDSSKGVSDGIFTKYADFISKFENEHADYFDRNKVHLKTITIVDSLNEKGTSAAGAYYNDSRSIKLMKKAIETKPTSKLITYSKSDDQELHFLAHEYGHYIADTLEKNLKIDDYEIIQNSLLRYFDNDIFMAKTSNLEDALGSYGSRDAHEAFAEAFAEAYTCKEPGKFAKIFREELEKILGSRR